MARGCDGVMVDGEGVVIGVRGPLPDGSYEPLPPSMVRREPPLFVGGRLLRIFEPCLYCGGPKTSAAHNRFWPTYHVYRKTS